MCHPRASLPPADACRRCFLGDGEQCCRGTFSLVFRSRTRTTSVCTSLGGSVTCSPAELGSRSWPGAVTAAGLRQGTGTPVASESCPPCASSTLPHTLRFLQSPPHPMFASCCASRGGEGDTLPVLVGRLEIHFGGAPSRFSALPFSFSFWPFSP